MIRKIGYSIRKYVIKSSIFNFLSILTADYVVVSFQKCGKTWLRLMLAQAISLKYKIRKIHLDLQLMTWFRPIPNILISHAGSTKDNNKLDFIKLFQKKKIIFLVRDPRDIVVSLFHGSRTRDKVYSGNNVSEFIRDKNSGFPKIINFLNTWADHLGKRKKGSYIIVQYEDMKKDAAKQLGRIFEFMNIDMPTAIIQDVVGYGSFQNMRKLEMSGKIKDYRMLPGDKKDPTSFRTRKGKIGGYKDELSKKDIAYLNSYMKKLDARYGYKI